MIIFYKIYKGKNVGGKKRKEKKGRKAYSTLNVKCRKLQNGMKRRYRGLRGRLGLGKTGVDWDRVLTHTSPNRS